MLAYCIFFVVIYGYYVYFIPSPKKQIDVLFEKELCLHNSYKRSLIKLDKYNLKIYYVHTLLDKNKPTLLLLHGSFASSFPYIHISDCFREKYNIVIPDLPGWGISDGISISNKSSDEILTFYIQTLREFIQKTINTPIYIVAHSFSCFLTIHLCHSYPDLVDKIVLLSPCGLLPVTSKNGMYWATFFKFSIHYHIIYFFKPFFTILAYCGRLNKYLKLSILQYCLKIPVYSVINKFLYYDIGTSYWKKICLQEFGELRIPTSIITGCDDDITPVQHGCAIAKLSNNQLKPFGILNCWHLPHLSVKFKNVLCQSLENDVIPYDVIDHNKIQLFYNRLKYTNYKGYWSKLSTINDLTQMYQHLFEDETITLTTLNKYYIPI